MSADSMAPAPGRVPIMESVRAGFEFVAHEWRAILPLSLLAAALLTPLEVWQQGAAPRGDMGGVVASSVIASLVSLFFTAAYLRRALSQGTGTLALKAGADEANLAGAMASIAFLFFIVACVGLIVIAFALAGLLARSGVDAQALQSLPPAEAGPRLMAALGSDGTFVFFSLLALCVVLVLWLTARLTLAYPATVAEKRMRIFDTWAWTKGHSLSIVACVLLVALGGLGLMWVVSQPIGLVLQMIFGKDSIASPGAPANWIFAFVSAGLANFFYAPAHAAMTAYLYLGLRPPAPPAS